ncbi:MULTISPECIES: PLP-dependent aminotransferase family protein [Ralstonia]|uniref:aminotransferase-like domain-containing protein n=1 Tax=Ralstonia TaxID=48736 RepID=UPI00055B35A1|nr:MULTISPECIES: PLP-dependent aminotransferase family protein [Ralstonia]
MPLEHLELDLHHPQRTLVDQIVQGIRTAVENRSLPPGTRLPSVRKLAQAHDVSTFTVAEAYTRLAALGAIVARPRSGYLVAARAPAQPASVAPRWEPPKLNAAWLLSDVFADRSIAIKPGCGWLPNDWLDERGVQEAMRAVSRVSALRVAGYGHPWGYAPLGETVAESLTLRGLPVERSQVLLTSGATQALDLIVRTLFKAGDVVAVDEPGYCNVLQVLKLAGLRVVGVPRTPDGLDTTALEAILRTDDAERPRALFTSSVLQNPTGTSMTAQNAYRVLQLAEQHGLWIVEDDLHRELADPAAPMLAALDGLRRTLYVSGFSKTISPSLRAGYVVADAAIARELARTKMAVALTSSEITERIVHAFVTRPVYAEHVARLTARLAKAHADAETLMRTHGAVAFDTPGRGLFLWARLPGHPNASALADQAIRHNIWLAPGQYFRTDETVDPWLRFNVAYSAEPALWAFLAQQ